jgi:hypothetical protein
VIHFHMPHTQPLITPEELQCLLGSAPARGAGWGARLWQHVLHVGAALWLVKGIFLYGVLMSPETASLVGSSRYFWLRGSLELVCLSAFWGAALHPRGRSVAFASMLVASTTLLMDAMTLLALAG